MAVGASGVSGLFWTTPITPGNQTAWLTPGVLEDGGVPIGGVSIGGTVVGGTSGSVLFVDSGGKLGQNNSGLFWDDTALQLKLNGAPLRQPLTTATQYYISTTGSNVTGTGAIGNPWATLQFAYDWICANVDTDNNDVTINLVAGTYTGNLLIFKPWTGGGSVRIVGNVAAPTNYVISSTGHCIASFIPLPGPLFVQGIQVTTTGPSSNGIANFCPGTAITINGNVSFGACGLSHLYAQFGGLINVTAGYQIDGNAQYHFVVDRQANIAFNGAYTVTINGVRTFSGEFAHTNGVCTLGPFQGTTFVLAIGASVAGVRFLAQDNSLITTGTNDINFFPGSSPGTTNSECLYDDVMYGSITIDMSPYTNNTPLTIKNFLASSSAKPIIDIAGTWNTTSQIDAIKVTLTDTASNANSNFAEFINSGTKARITKLGGYYAYNQFTDYSNNESGFLDWQTNIFTLGVASNGAGTTRSFQFKFSGTSVLDYNVTSGNNWTFSPSNKRVFIGSETGVAGVTAAQLLYLASGQNSGTAGPQFVMNMTSSDYVGLGPASTGSMTSNAILRLGQAASLGAVWKTTSVTSLEIFNGSLRFGDGTNIDVALQRNGAGLLEVNSTTAGTLRDLTLRDLFTNDASFILRTKTTITGGGTANAPTLTSGPVTGNPTKWLPFDDNGTTRYIPAW